MNNIVLTTSDGALVGVEVVIALATKKEDIPQVLIHGRMEQPIGSGEMVERLLLIEDGALYDISNPKVLTYLGEVA